MIFQKYSTPPDLTPFPIKNPLYKVVVRHTYKEDKMDIIILKDLESVFYIFQDIKNI